MEPLRMKAKMPLIYVTYLYVGEPLSDEQPGDKPSTSSHIGSRGSSSSRSDTQWSLPATKSQQPAGGKMESVPLLGQSRYAPSGAACFLLCLICISKMRPHIPADMTPVPECFVVVGRDHHNQRTACQKAETSVGNTW